jgi:hypothetical protein
MFTRLLKVVPALCLSLGILASGSFYANAAELPYIGLECTDRFESQPGTSVKGGNDLVNLICFESTNYPDKFVWSKDNNDPPANFWIDKKTIAYGGDVEKDSDACLNGPRNSKFAEKYPDIYCENKYVFLIGKTEFVVWRSEVYEKGIDKIAWVPPLENTASEVVEDVPADDQGARKASKDSTTFVVLATFAMMMTSAASTAMIRTPQNSSSDNFPRNTPGGQGVPEYIEISARRDEKLKIEGARKKFLRFLLNPAVTLAKYRFFENYLRIRIEKISRFTPGFATIIRDGDYLRAVLGSITFLLYPLAILTGIFGFIEIQSRPGLTSPSTLLSSLLPSFICMALMIAIGVLDSLAGALAGATFVTLVFFVNVFHLGIPDDSKRIFSTLISIFLISCTPPLFAGVFRKFDGLHRDPGRNWNYAVDYLLSPLVTGWMVWKVIGVISDLSGAEFDVKDAPLKIATLIWFALIIRYFIEHYVSRNWGDRLNEMISNDLVQSRISILLRTVLKSAWIWILITSIGTFQNGSAAVPMIIALFALPSLIKLMWKNPSNRLGSLNLRGAPKLALLFLLGIALTQLLKDPDLKVHEELILEIALVPLLFFSIIDALTEEHTHTPRYFVENKWGVRMYRSTGAAIYIFIAGYIYYMINGYKLDLGLLIPFI